MPGRTPHGRALDALLADGAWHDREEAVALMVPHVPPGQAYRRAEQSRKRMTSGGPRTIGDEQSAITTGRRSIAVKLITSRAKRGRIEQTVVDGTVQIRRRP